MTDLTIERPGSAGAGRIVTGEMNYTGPMTERARYYANDHSRDVLNLDPRQVGITDVRGLADPPTLDREGFVLVPNRSAVADFRDRDEVLRVHPAEIERLLLELTGADRVVVGGGGVLRFGERSPESGTLMNSRPARFIHIDCSDPTAVTNAERSRPVADGRPTPLSRFCHYNVWRVISPPPQDVPLAVCDARTLKPEDLILADAVFDAPDAPEWSFEGLVIGYSPDHRWSYYSGMTRDEALVFKTNDSDPGRAHHVPHSAFNDPTCPPDVEPRASIEMRACAYWFA